MSKRLTYCPWHKETTLVKTLEVADDGSVFCVVCGTRATAEESEAKTLDNIRSNCMRILDATMKYESDKV